MYVYVHTHMNDALGNKCICSRMCILTFWLQGNHAWHVWRASLRISTLSMPCVLLFVLLAGGMICLLIRSHEIHMFLYTLKTSVFLPEASNPRVCWLNPCFLAPSSVPGLHQSQLSMHRQKLLENFMDWTKVCSAAVLGHEFVASGRCED